MPAVDPDLLPPEERGYSIAPEGSLNITSFKPQGPVGTKFLQDRESMIRGLMGPFGSGKTNLAYYDCFQWAVLAPVTNRRTSEDQGFKPIRMFGAISIRDTYRNLETLIKSWHGWASKQEGDWTGGAGDRPAKHVLEYDLVDGTRLEFLHEFRAIGDRSIEEAMLGAEFNWMFPNELTTLGIDILTYGVGRIGRYPRANLFDHDDPQIREQRVAKRPARIVTDFNAPEVGSEVYRYWEEQRPDNAKLYRQPGGRSPAAENLKNLPPGYYDNMVTANIHRPWWIRRFVDNEYGFSRAGQPVFMDEYQDDAHCPGVIPVHDLPVYIGLDGGMGLHPAAVIKQWSPQGWIDIVLSLYIGRAGPARFAEALRDLLRQECKGLPIAGVAVDPAAFRGIDAESGEVGFVDVVAKAIGAPPMPCWTNELGPRLDVWRKTLTRWVGQRPMLRVSSRCHLIRRGLNSEYHYKKDDAGNLTQDPKPDKSKECTHEIDAGGYGLCNMLGREFVLHDRTPQPRYIRAIGRAGQGAGAGNRTMRTDFNL